MAEEGPGGRVGPAGGLGWGTAGGSLGPVVGVDGGATALFWETPASLLNHCTCLSTLIT